uniref:Uncharacterized protein n=2 Tax=Canis lupus familiaris TaxID=9615 RepID=A0A8C0NC37_CANLF
MTGFLLPPRKQSAPSSLPPGTRRSCSRSRKRQTRRRRNPSSFVASCPTLLPFACVPGASPTTLAFSPAVLTGSSTDGIPFALSLQRVPFRTLVGWCYGPAVCLSPQPSFTFTHQCVPHSHHSTLRGGPHSRHSSGGGSDA